MRRLRFSTDRRRQLRPPSAIVRTGTRSTTNSPIKSRKYLPWCLSTTAGMLSVDHPLRAPIQFWIPQVVHLSGLTATITANTLTRGCSLLEPVVKTWPGFTIRNAVNWITRSSATSNTISSKISKYQPCLLWHNSPWFRPQQWPTDSMP